MDLSDISQSLLEGLVELEQAGDLAITHAAPIELADKLRSKLVERWAKEFVAMPPHEVVIANGIRSATGYLETKFSVPHEQALSVVRRFMEDRRAERTLPELADLVAHQGYQDIALGAYYCVHLGRGKYYDPDYLTWRSTAPVR
jgi:hypothetical protein